MSLAALPLDRDRVRGQLADQGVDLLVVGAGATGAGAALEAAARGLSVALVDAGDIASGTSSRSSRLVHGGLRYLAHGDVGLVRESVAERGRLATMAPHLVRPVELLLPRAGRPDAAALEAGLTLYDALATGRSLGRHRRLDAVRMASLLPPGAPQAVEGGWSYRDCATDDARLVLAVVRAAAARGARVLTRTRVIGWRTLAGRVVGAELTDGEDGTSWSLDARAVIAATGVWADEARGLAGLEPLLRPSRGVHLVIPGDLVGLDRGVVLPSPAGDGRQAFVLPYAPGEVPLRPDRTAQHVVIGTTDVEHSGDLDSPGVTAAEAEFLLSTLSSGLGIEVSVADCVGGWAGLRPLLRGAVDADPEAVSRRHLVIEDPPGLVTVTGGKLTTFRRMAEDAVDAVGAALGRPRAAGTHRLHLGLRSGVPEAVARLATLCDVAGADPVIAGPLVARHGAEAPAVLARGVETDGLGPLVDGLDVLEVEARWAVEVEGARTAADVLRRRLGIAVRDPDAGGAAVEAVARQVAAVTGLDPVADAARFRGEVATERGVVTGPRVPARRG